jgi:hypothetical protein
MADVSGKLTEHRANAPAPPTDDVTLLDHLPLMEIDLNQLAADRQRRFLDAFRVEIHYDHRSRRATLKAEISADLMEQLRQVAHWGGRPITAARKDDAEPIMHSSGLCPRPDTTHNCARSGRLSLVTDVYVGD